MKYNKEQEELHKGMYELVDAVLKGYVQLSDAKLQIKKAINDGLDLNYKKQYVGEYEDIRLLEYTHYECQLYPSRWHTASIELQQFFIEEGARPVVGLSDKSFFNLSMEACIAAPWNNVLESEDIYKNVRFCLENGANPNWVVDQKDDIPLFHIACCNESAELAELFIKHGADVNSKHKTHYETLIQYHPINNFPVHLATNHPELMQVLIDSGADIHADDLHYGTPLHRAAAFPGNIEVISILLSAGADINAKNKREGLTVLEEARRSYERINDPDFKSDVKRIIEFLESYQEKQKFEASIAPIEGQATKKRTKI